MATAARSREASLKPARVTKALNDGSNMDIEGFRMGKQRIVGKKKKQSALKKRIVAEREVRSEDKISGSMQHTPAWNTEVCGLDGTLDVPAYIPAWTFPDVDLEQRQSDNAEVNTVADAAGTGGIPVQSAIGRNVEVLRDGGKRRQGERLTGATAEYLPSWIVQGDVAHEESASVGEKDSDRELLVSAAIEHLRVVDEGSRQKKKEKPKQPAKTTSNIEVRHYVHQVLSDELDEKVKAILGELARFQERARERDPLKYQKQKRFCVGLREASRNVARGKTKCLIMAPNMEASSAEGGLDDTVEDLMDLCRENEVPVVYALSRNRIGKALGKNIRLSIVCILSAEGVHQEFRQMIKMADELRKQWVMRRMSTPVEAVAQAVARSGAPSGVVSGVVSGAVSGAASDNEDGGQAAANCSSFAESISERVRRHLQAKQDEANRKREEEREARAAERAANKERKAKERAAKQAAKRAEQKAAKEAEEREKEEQEEKERQAEEERRRALAERDAARQAEIARRDKERAEAEKRRAAEAAVQKAAEVEEEDEADSDDSDLPIGFCADLL